MNDFFVIENLNPHNQ